MKLATQKPSGTADRAKSGASARCRETRDWNTGEKTATPFSTDALSGWRSLRAIRFAGYFEGQSTLAIGVNETLPFRVTTQLDTTTQIRRLVIDITHAH
jgi:hypothetical protein